jgi:hypothetical protein
LTSVRASFKMRRESGVTLIKTLVVQSYRTGDVAPWIRTCLESVQAWATARGYRYEFMGDRLFEYAPLWVRKRCGGQILPVTDVARMYLLRERLRLGWERVVWIDADVLVFAPERFALDDSAPYTLCDEVWLRLSHTLETETVEKVHNAVMMVTPRQPMLDFWIFAVEEILRAHAPQDIGPLTAGTHFFTNLAKTMPLRVLRNVGLFSPPVVRDLASGGGESVRRWAQDFNHPIGAANLCASLQDRELAGVRIGADEMQRAVDILLRTRGAIVNDYLALVMQRA